MLFRLALAMGRTVGELRAVLSYREFVQWCQFFELEPWGEAVADFRAGMICATVANMAGKVRTEGIDPAVPSDFMPRLRAEQIESMPIDERELTDDELAAWADAAIYGIPPDG